MKRLAISTAAVAALGAWWFRTQRRLENQDGAAVRRAFLAGMAAQRTLDRGEGFEHDYETALTAAALEMDATPVDHARVSEFLSERFIRPLLAEMDEEAFEVDARPLPSYPFSYSVAPVHIVYGPDPS